MHANHNTRVSQQHRVRAQAHSSDAYAFFSPPVQEQKTGIRRSGSYNADGGRR